MSIETEKPKAKNREVLTLVRVDADVVLRRNGKPLDPKLFLKEVKMNGYIKSSYKGDSWKKAMGNKGLMLKEDYDNGIFVPYGINPERVQGFTKVQKLEDANTELQKKIAELEAELAAKETKTKKTKETTNE